jgi:hypothetical protein
MLPLPPPSAEFTERRSPKLPGWNGGEGRNGAIGEDDNRPYPPGDGGTRGELDVAGGPGPRGGSGDACLKEGDGECSEGEPEESVDALKGLSGFSCGRRIGSGPGRDGRSYTDERKIRKAPITP